MSSAFQAHSAAPPTSPVAPVDARAGDALRLRARATALAVRRPRPELSSLIVLAGALNLWALGRNGWANDYYSAAVRSMSPATSALARKRR